MFYGLIYIFQALFKMHVDITNQKAAVVGNVSYYGKVMEQHTNNSMYTTHDN
jgi:hypothetical protein